MPPTSKNGHQTWLDLMPPGNRPAKAEMLTRDELLTELKDRGVELNDTTLVFYEKSGVLPRAVRSRRDGSPVALYPDAAVDWIAYARQLQDSGTPLSQLAPLVRTHVLLSTGHGEIDTTPGVSDVVSALESALATFAAWHERTHGTPVATADARLLDTAGNELQRFAFDADRSLRHRQ